MPRAAGLVTKQELALAVAALERKIDRLDAKIDEIEARLLLKLSAGMAAGFGLMLAAIGIAVAVLLNNSASASSICVGVIVHRLVWRRASRQGIRIR